MTKEEIIYEVNLRFKLGDITQLRKKNNRIQDYEFELFAETLREDEKKIRKAFDDLYKDKIKLRVVNKKFKLPYKQDRNGDKERGIIRSLYAGQEYKTNSHISLCLDTGCNNFLLEDEED